MNYKLDFIYGICMLREYNERKRVNCSVCVENNQNNMLEFTVPVGKTFEKIAEFSHRILNDENLKSILGFEKVSFEFNGILCVFNSNTSVLEMEKFFYEKLEENN